MRAFSLIGSWMSGSSKLHFLPVDEIESSILEDADYKRLYSSRMEKTHAFLRSREFASSTSKCSISSIPRWGYMRQLHFDLDGKRCGGEDDADESEGGFEFVAVPADLRERERSSPRATRIAGRYPANTQRLRRSSGIFHNPRVEPRHTQIGSLADHGRV